MTWIYFHPMISCYIINIYKNFVRFISDYEQPIQFFSQAYFSLDS